MANTAKDIVIYPAKGSTSIDPRVDFVANDDVTTANISIRVLTEANGTLVFSTNTSANVEDGHLVSIANSYTNNCVLIVYNESGTPSLEVYANGRFAINSVDPTAALPVSAQTAAYIPTHSDAGKLISITTGGVTIPNTVFQAGEVITIYNDSGSNQTIANGVSVTMYLGGTATGGNRTLAQRGVCTVLCVAANTFIASGAGVT